MGALGPRWWAARPRWQFAAAIVFLAGAAASYAACFTKLATAPQPEGVCRPAAQELFAFIRQQTAPDAVIAFAKPRAMALLGARRAGACRRSNADEQLWDDLRFSCADHLVVTRRDEVFSYDADQEQEAMLRAFVARHPAPCDEVHRDADFAVYKIEYNTGMRALQWPPRMTSSLEHESPSPPAPLPQAGEGRNS